MLRKTEMAKSPAHEFACRSTKTLDKFLKEWKEDLRDHHHSSQQGVDTVLGKRIQEDDLNDDSDNLKIKSVKTSGIGDSSNAICPLFVLPSPHSHSKKNELSSAVQTRVKCSKKDSANLVDTLISDLNEVNCIPFFDIQLPREIALIIFSHLSIKDLGTCSLVSKSWNALAEDNVLWYRICFKLSPVVNVGIDPHWKAVVKEIIISNKKVLQNWKERKCGLVDYQPDDAGVLISASYSSSTLISCYTSGLSMVWNITGQSGAIPVKWLTSNDGSRFTCCSASSNWGAIGTQDGSVHIIDVHSCSEVQCLVETGSICAVDVSCEAERLVVAAVSMQTRFDDSTVYKTSVYLTSDDNSWERTQFSSDNSVNQMRLLSQSECGLCLLYSTSTTLTLHPLHSAPIHILSPSTHTSYVSCFDNNSTQVACGTSMFGYKVQVFDLQSASVISSFRGHNQHVSCVDIFKESPTLFVSGSADKCVRVFDSRASSLPVVQLYGHGSSVSSVQMDDWKVVSGSLDGYMIVWDRRMSTELWRSHERHPVSLCRFDKNYLITCFTPIDKQPVVNSGNPFIFHRRQRGLVRVYDFSVETSCNVLPSVCTSAFDEPSASFYNLDLKYPYDFIS